MSNVQCLDVTSGSLDAHGDQTSYGENIPRSNEFFLAEKTTHGGRVG
jgi:hypothetical protein